MLTARPLGFADLTAVGDEVDVEIVDLFGANHSLKFFLRLLGAGLVVDKAESAGYSVDVGVNR